VNLNLWNPQDLSRPVQVLLYLDRVVHKNQDVINILNCIC
jgi:hypothetical protein